MRLIFFIGLAVVFFPAGLLAQVSPGPLSDAHVNLEGVLGCTNCHTFGTRRPELKCLSCHMDIRERLENKTGYHARIVDRSRGDTDCARCHAEHAGRSFNLIRWPAGLDHFDHSQTGYALNGKHASLSCAQCHKPDAAHAGRSTYLGLDRTCGGCHRDPHRSELGAECTTCHTQDSWRPASLFKHASTRFALSGAHVNVQCQRCHEPGSGNLLPASFKRDGFTNCATCHKDRHSGGFKTSCSTCHTPANWRVAKSSLTANFDHSKTAYPLKGKHLDLACASCHKTSNFGQSLKSERCMDCHTDKHKGQFLTRPDRGDCGGCHTVDSFKTATFDRARHTSTKYPLLGRHIEVDCKNCHEPKAENTDYHPKSANCTDCHKDAHDNQFQKRFDNKCESCHTVNGFKPATYTLAKHRESRFALSGAHLAVACIDCHESVDSPKSHRYVFPDLACTACHADPHEIANASLTCETCHSVQNWSSFRFDHDATRFALRGPHRVTACQACHKAPGAEGSTVQRVVFHRTATECAGCHQDIHAGQFANRSGGTNCETCHSVAGWRPSLFDHRQTSFVLDGAHRNVACAACHKGVTSSGGGSALIYAKAPKECAGCH